MADNWPGTVNLGIKRPSYREKPERYVAQSKPDVGPPLERRRSAFRTELLSCEGRYTETEYAALIAFYRDTLLDGTLPFNRAHPRSGTTTLMKFEAEPDLVSIGAIHRHVSFVLRTLP